MWDYWIGSSSDADIEKSAALLLKQLKQEKEGQRIVKATFFAACDDKATFSKWIDLFELKARDIFSYPVMVSLIPQTPIDTLLYIEAWTLDDDKVDQVELGKNQHVRWIHLSGRYELLIVNTHALSGAIEEDSVSCFSGISKIIQDKGYPMNQLFRQWNYVGDILKVEDGKQNYQVFNEIRASFFASSDFPDGYPAATGIGMDVPGVVIEACFSKSEQYKQIGISNPLQQAAHHYSEKVLISEIPKKSTPKFERAKAVINGRNSTVFISGTAAIVGEDSSSSAIPEEQTEQTLHVIHRLIDKDNLKKYIHYNGTTKSYYKNVRVYLKNGYISDEIKRKVSQFFKYANPVYLKADVCRNNLLVEIEAELKIN